MKKVLNIFVLVLFIITSFISFSPISFAGSSVVGIPSSNPKGITIDASGNIYTANQEADNVSKITPEGVSTILGTTGDRPREITIDAEGNIYTANEYSDNVSKITPEGVSTILGTTGDGPYSITIDASGNVYTGNINSSNVSKITPEGVSTILGVTSSPPYDIAVDIAGNVYTANYESGDVSKITPEGVSTVLGTVISYSPRQILVDTSGNVYVSDGGEVVDIITPGGISSIFEIVGYYQIQDMIMDTGGNIYLSVHDYSGNKNVVKLSSDSFFTSTYLLSEDENYYIDHDARTIEYVSPGTSKADFLLNIRKNNEAQVLNTDSVSDPVQEGDTIIITAEDGETSATYTIGALLSTDATISSEVYTITIDGNEGTIEDVPSGTSLDDFFANLTKGNENQYLDYYDSGNVNDPVEDGDTLVVWAEDEETYITYTIYLAADLYWYNAGIDANWNTLTGNWWTDRNYTVQAGALPTWEDSVETLGTVGPIVDIDDWENPESLDATATGVTFSSAASAPFNSTTFNITGDATFNGTIVYNGTLNGNAVFNDTSRNVSFSTVQGNAIFNDSSQNSGAVSGYACFRDESENNGTVGGLLCPPTVITSPATEITKTSATLNGDITDEIESVDELGFEYGLTTSYGNTAIDEDYLAEETFSASISGLTCGTTYHIRAYGTNDFDTSYGEDSTFTTSSCVDEQSGGSSSGSVKPKTNITPTSSTTCLPGEKYNTQTGKPCTTFTSSPNTPTTCTLTMTLRQGYRGEQVKCLQTKLNIKSDGIFGPMTKSSVISFQKLKSLVPDGVVGVRTRGELK